MYVSAVEDIMCIVCVSVTEGIVVMDVICHRLCVSMILELLMCGGDVRSILLLPFVVRCLETIDVCTWRMLVLCLL